MTLEINFLLKNLEATRQVWGQLLQVSREEQKALIENKGHLLEDFARKKNSILEIIDSLEKTKKRILSEFKKENKLNFELLGYQDLIPYLPEHTKPRVIWYIGDIKDTMLAIKASNANNTKLLSYGMQLINFMITSFKPHGEEQVTYTAEGSYNKPQQRSKVEYCF